MLTASFSFYTEQEETEGFHHVETPNISVGSNVAGDGGSEIQPDYLSKDKKHERKIESKVEEGILETNEHHQLQKQASVKKG